MDLDRSPLSNSEYLRVALDLSAPQNLKPSQTLYHHPQLKRLYPQYLVALHGIMRASVRLLETARDRCLELGAKDTIASSLAPYFGKHVEEERGHDIWVLEDLEELGFGSDDVLNRTPSSAIAQLVGSQYYWINHVHPLTHLGYMEVAEGNPPSIELVDFLEHRTGFPRSAFRCIERHSIIDKGHGADLHSVLDSLTFTPKQRRDLSINALDTVRLSKNVFDEVIKEGNKYNHH